MSDEDEDIDAPSLDELACLARLLRESNQRERLKGKIGRALQELARIEERIAGGNVAPEERVSLGVRLWALNGEAHSPETGALGVGRFPWRPKRRPKGAPSEKTVNINLDNELLEQAKHLFQIEGSVGAAMRKVVKNALAHNPKAFAAQIQIDSHIKRLSRKAKRLRLFAD